ncbi:MAG: hypothetical protein GX369_03260 [Euryarchaeota archaeon]|nr:hypothetical protein [Euryarchaeota archaeon]
MIDIEDVILQRIEQIEEDDPELDVGYEIIGDENRGIIITAWEDILISVEFVESDISWKRELAELEYLDARNENLIVAVIVPTDAYLEVYSRLRDHSIKGLLVLSYESLGILSTPMTS